MENKSVLEEPKSVVKLFGQMAEFGILADLVFFDILGTFMINVYL